MKVVKFTLNTFLPRILGESGVLIRDNTTLVAYLKKQGVTVSRVKCNLSQEIVAWLELHSATLSARYIFGKRNILADQSSRPDHRCHLWGCTHIDLFVTTANMKLPLLYLCPQFQIPWLESKMLLNFLGMISVLVSFPLCSSETGLVKSDAFDKSCLGPGGS